MSAQGFSISFDASVEELWLAWASGGALFCATPDIIHAGPALSGNVAQGLRLRGHNQNVYLPEEFKSHSLSQIDRHVSDTFTIQYPSKSGKQ